MPPQPPLHSHSTSHETKSHQSPLHSRLQTLDFTLTKTNATHTAEFASALAFLREGQMVPDPLMRQRMQIFANMLDEDRRLLVLVRSMQRAFSEGWSSQRRDSEWGAEVVGAGAVGEAVSGSDGGLAPGVQGLTLESGGEMEDDGDGDGGYADEMAEEMAEETDEDAGCEGGCAVSSGSGSEGNGAEADVKWEGVDSSETETSSDSGGVAL